jgi:Na+/proline symporter
MNFNIDMFIFIGFLILNLVVGIRYGKEVRSIKDYAIGDRNFSTSALVSTIVATWATGSSFFVILSKTYADGISFAIAVCCLPISLLITAIFFVPKMEEFMGALSIGEVMGKLYGKEVRMITAICGILGCVGAIAVQFKVFGNIFNYFFGIPSEFAIIIASFIVILYSAFGGIKAVTYTDVLQFFTFGFVIPFIGIISTHLI